MSQPIQSQAAIYPFPNPINRSPSRCGVFLLLLACFALSPTARAVDPPPDGGYSGANTAEGTDALFSLDVTSGVRNTAIGFRALYSTIDGHDNTASGFDALYSNTDGEYNSANGARALGSNTTGCYNTANGARTLYWNETGRYNTADGYQALFSNRTGDYNTAEGVAALYTNTTGIYNTASGYRALYFNTIGIYNTANGSFALYRNETGNYNTAYGEAALLNNTTGDFNIALGKTAGADLTTGNNNIDIGNRGVAGESNRIRIGTKGTQTATFIAGIFGVSTPGGAAVYVNSNGKLGTTPSSRRFKKDIADMDGASEALFSLRPVSFRYKQELDPESNAQFGLVAEEVEKVDPDLVVHDEKGEVYSVRYEAVNAMLLNEFLKEHRTVQKQETTIAEMKSAIAKQETTNAQQQKQIEALTATVQKVSAQLEVSKPASQLVVNNQ